MSKMTVTGCARDRGTVAGKVTMRTVWFLHISTKNHCN